MTDPRDTMLNAARALHERGEYDPRNCDTCSDSDGHNPVPWPCPTATALGATGRSEWATPPATPNDITHYRGEELIAAPCTRTPGHSGHHHTGGPCPADEPASNPTSSLSHEVTTNARQPNITSRSTAQQPRSIHPQRRRSTNQSRNRPPSRSRPLLPSHRRTRRSQLRLRRRNMARTHRRDPPRRRRGRGPEG